MTKKERKVKYESLTIKQAQHKNCGEEAHFQLVKRIFEREQAQRLDDIERERRKCARILQETRHVHSVSGQLVNNFHKSQKRNLEAVCLHIVDCYMQRQEKNKALWKTLQSESANEKRMAPERPVTSPDHLLFVHKSFPEIYNFTVGLEELPKSKNANIYEHGRAGHCLNCHSTPSKPVGGYNHRGPINFRNWEPPPDILAETMSEVLPKAAPAKRGKRKTSKTIPLQTTEADKLGEAAQKKSSGKSLKQKRVSFVNVPLVGLMQISDDKVIMVEDDSLKTKVPKLPKIK